MFAVWGRFVYRWRWATLVVSGGLLVISVLGLLMGGTFTSGGPVTSDLEAARALSSSPAALDLFMWLSYRCFTARGRERVPLFGDFGLISQLGSADYARPRKFREKLEGWLDLVRTMWPECPASIDKDGTGLFVDRANAVLPTGGTDAHN